MIDDINVSDTDTWKYENDTTIAEPVAKNKASTIQDSVNDLVIKFNENKFQLNESKCKAVRHVPEIFREVPARLYFLKQYKRAGVEAKELITFYKACIRSVIEYTSPLFDTLLSSYLSDQVEGLQRRAMIPERGLL